MMLMMEKPGKFRIVLIPGTLISFFLAHTLNGGSPKMDRLRDKLHLPLLLSKIEIWRYTMISRVHCELSQIPQNNMHALRHLKT